MSNLLETWTICPQQKMLVWNFWQTHYYVPVCAQRMRRLVCQRKWEERVVCETAHTSRTTKSNTQTIMGFIRDPILLACLGKPRAICKHGTLTRMLQGVAVGRRRKSNSLLFSESTASPTTKLTRTSITCRESLNKSKKLVTTKEFLEKTQYSLWTDREEN